MRLRNIPGADAAVTSCPFVIRDAAALRGRWNQDFSINGQIHIEIGMGKGQFLFSQAAAHPDVFYIGVERYPSVLLRAIQKIDPDAPPENLRMLCMDAAKLPEIFAKGEVSKIYLNFSDPWPKDRHKERRLTSSRFLGIYERILASYGSIEFKTDNRPFFEFSLKEITASPSWEISYLTYNLHDDPMLSSGNIMTEYEEKFSSLGHPICKLCAVLA